MDKIEYKVKEGKKSVEKSIELKDLSWSEWCKAQDISFMLQNPNGSMFTNIANYVQLYTGKTEPAMLEWRDSFDFYGDFQSELITIAREIGNHLSKKKK